MSESERRSGYEDNPDFKIVFEPSPRRVRVMAGGETIADSTDMRLLHEPGHLPIYYFPRGDVRMDLLQESDHDTHCPWKGVARYWTVAAGGKTIENVAWSYDDPYPQVAEIAGYVSFTWSKMDHWYEEDEEVFVHARNPYTRVDVLQSSRHVVVEVDGVVVADSHQPRLLFETGLPVRYYLPKTDVRMDLLRASEHHTDCPYKGTASYYDVVVDGTTHTNLAWWYPGPVLESAKIAGYVAFYDEKVDVLVDGVRQARPETPFSS
jgi:uncharacterized protein (DUF427 family)